MDIFPSQENDPIRKYQTQLRQAHERAEQLRPTLRACQDAIARAQSKAMAIITSEKGPYGDRPYINLMLATETLDDSVPLIRELAKDGIRSHEKQFEDQNLLDVLSIRRYKLTRDVTLSVLLTGEQCKMRQVGTKVVPVYEMQCGDGSQLVDDKPRAAIPAVT